MKTALLAAITATFLVITAVPALAGDAAVEQAQQSLKQAGHDPGPVDGVAGARTTAALKAYQKANGLSVTGRLDDATLARLGEAAPKSAGAAAAKSPSTTQTGGDTRPSAVDPAQASKTGANSGEGASYSRSTEKGLSTMPGGDAKTGDAKK
jgi:peptidoglycan hydrolase-like protein with peptidoglycan-binding domain